MWNACFSLIVWGNDLIFEILYTKRSITCISQTYFLQNKVPCFFKNKNHHLDTSPELRFYE